jgi:hypothetical protein
VIINKGYIPYIIRLNRGKKTPFVTEVYFALAYIIQNDLCFKLKDYWFYNISTANQQIEL